MYESSYKSYVKHLKAMGCWDAERLKRLNRLRLWFRKSVFPAVVIPSPEPELLEFSRHCRQLLSELRSTPVKRRCIACGRWHITSEECGREGPDVDPPDAGTRMGVGYRLSRAEGMGFYNEGILE